jgi:hypothetical protein
LGKSSNGQQYWVGATPWDDKQLSRAALDVAVRAIASSHCPKADRKRVCDFLFNISMCCLADARGNYFWPALHREIVSRLPKRQIHPTESALTTFFRNALLASESTALQSLYARDIHHRYRALIFEQAGIGKDRNKIIAGFLDWLVDFRSGQSSDAASDWVDRAVEAYSSTQPEPSRHDTLLLSGVLARIGAELIRLVDAIERHPKRFEILNWSWEQLRNWWMSESGADLDSLTPSAADVLRGWIAKLSAVWTRSEIFRLSRAGRLTCHWPDGSDAGAYDSYLHLPLGAARLKVGSRTSDIVVADLRELSPPDLLALEHNKWHVTDDDFHFKVSEKRFREDHPVYGLVRSSPVFLDAFRGQPALYYWGKRVRSRIAVQGPIIWLPTTFKWRAGKLLIALGTIRVNAEDGDGYAITLGSEQLWTGRVRNGTLLGWAPRHLRIEGLLRSGESTLQVTLTRDHQKLAQKALHIWPLQHEAFLVCGGVVCTPFKHAARWMETSSDSWRTSLILRSPSLDVSLSNIHELSRSDVQILGTSHTEIRLSADPGERAAVQAGELRWSIDFRLRLGLAYLQDQEVRRGPVSFVSAGNARVAEGPHSLALKCSRRPDAKEGIGLWISTGGSECFCELDNSAVAEDRGIHIIDIAKLAIQNGLSIRSGVLSARIGTALAASADTYNFLLPPDRVDVQPTQLGKPSGVILFFDDEQRRISSNASVSLVDANELKFSHSTISEDEWEVTARWLPRIVDVLVGGDVGVECDYTYKLFREGIRGISNSIDCRPVLTTGDKLSLSFLDRVVSVPSGSSFDILPELRSAIATGQSKTRVLAAHDSVAIAWTIDALPVISNVTNAIESQIGDLLQVTVAFTALSLVETELVITYQCATLPSETRTVWTKPDARFETSFSPTFHATRGRNGHLDFEWTVHACGELVYRAKETVNCCDESLPLPCPPTKADALRRLVDAYRSTGAVAYLVEIFFSFLEGTILESLEYKALALGTKIGCGKAPEAESTFARSLRIVEAIASRSSAPLSLPTGEGVPAPISAIANSMWLVLSDRYAREGILKPPEFSRAIGVLRTFRETDCGDPRISGLVQAAYRFAAYIDRRYNLTTDSPMASHEAAVDHLPCDTPAQLGQLSREFKNWLESSNEQEID